MKRGFMVTWINPAYEDTYEFFDTLEEARKFFNDNKENCYHIFQVFDVTD